MIEFKSVKKLRVYEYSENETEKGFFGNVFFINLSADGKSNPGRLDITTTDKIIAAKAKGNLGKDVLVEVVINTDKFGTKVKLLDLAAVGS